MYCTACGAACPDAAAFCNACGQKVVADTGPVVPEAEVITVVTPKWATSCGKCGAVLNAAGACVKCAPNARVPKTRQRRIIQGVIAILVVYLAASVCAVCLVAGSPSSRPTDVKGGLPEAASHEERYRKPCEDGDGEACERLGTFYSNRGDRAGDGADLERAAALYRRACEDLRSAFGCWALAVHYKKGAGVPLDMERAASFSEQGCDLGNAGACAFLGNLYRSGNGVPRDEVRALELYRRGMELNSKER